jgi:hypothetical protein
MAARPRVDHLARACAAIRRRWAPPAGAVERAGQAQHRDGQLAQPVPQRLHAARPRVAEAGCEPRSGVGAAFGVEARPVGQAGEEGERQPLGDELRHTDLLQPLRERRVGRPSGSAFGVGLDAGGRPDQHQRLHRPRMVQRGAQAEAAAHGVAEEHPRPAGGRHQLRAAAHVGVRVALRAAVTGGIGEHRAAPGRDRLGQWPQARPVLREAVHQGDVRAVAPDRRCQHGAGRGKGRRFCAHRRTP